MVTSNKDELSTVFDPGFVFVKKQWISCVEYDSHMEYVWHMNIHRSVQRTLSPFMPVRHKFHIIKLLQSWTL